MALTKAHNRMIAGAAVNVKDFGAVGDGIADDTAAIQAALDTTKDVIFSDSVYRITSPLTVYSQRVIGGVGQKGINRPQSIINITGDHPCFVNGPGEISFEISGFFINYGTTAPTVSSGNSNKIGFYFTTNTLWPAFSKIKNCTVRGAWEAFFDNTGTYQSILEEVFSWNCKRAFYKQNGTTIKFDTCMAQGGTQGFYIKDTISPTLVNVAADQLSVTTTENAGNYFEGCRSLSINGWDAEGNTVTGNEVSYLRIRQSTAHIAGFTGYQNTLSCTTGEECYLLKVDEGSTANFSGCRPARNTADLAYSGSGGSPTTLLAKDLSNVSLTGCYFTAPTGGIPAVSFVANATLVSEVTYTGSTVSGTVSNAFELSKITTASGSWTPVLNSFTVSGTPVVTGKYTRTDNLVTCWVDINPNGGTVASVAATSAISDLPFTPTSKSVCMVSDNAVANVGIGSVTTAALVYTPAWSASGSIKTIQFSYYIGA